MKQETLEEAAYRLSAEKFEPKHIGFMLGVIEGAKWQDERMGYLIEALNAIESIIDNDNPSHENIWRIANSAIEQFKKK